MTNVNLWAPVVADQLEDILQTHPRPLEELAAGRVPAFILRDAYDPNHCSALVQRFYDRGLLFDPRKREGIGRVDIGTSIGTHGSDADRFFAHASQTHKLFETLFDGYQNPVDLVYQMLSTMAPDKVVETAREPDGRLYGPSIFRTYYEGRGHGPHTDTLWRDREQGSSRSHYAIARLDRQFSGVLCFQNAEDDGEMGQVILYRQRWSPQMPVSWNKTFHHDAAVSGTERVRVKLAVGDFYVFCSEYVHEVPAIKGEVPRIVLAAFFARSEEIDEIYVWP